MYPHKRQFALGGNPKRLLSWVEVETDFVISRNWLMHFVSERIIRNVRLLYTVCVHIILNSYRDIVMFDWWFKITNLCNCVSWSASVKSCSVSGRWAAWRVWNSRLQMRSFYASWVTRRTSSPGPRNSWQSYRRRPPDYSKRERCKAFFHCDIHGHLVRFVMLAYQVQFHVK